MINTDYLDKYVNWDYFTIRKREGSTIEDGIYIRDYHNEDCMTIGNNYTGKKVNEKIFLNLIKKEK